MNKRINERGKRLDVRLSRPHPEAGLLPSAMLARSPPLALSNRASLQRSC